MRQATVHLRVFDRNPGHTKAHVFVGRNPDARGNSGVLTFRTDEFDELFGDITGEREQNCVLALVVTDDNGPL